MKWGQLAHRVLFFKRSWEMHSVPLVWVFVLGVEHMFGEKDEYPYVNRQVVWYTIYIHMHILVFMQRLLSQPAVLR